VGSGEPMKFLGRKTQTAKGVVICERDYVIKKLLRELLLDCV
jgi:hypothetical protein